MFNPSFSRKIASSMPAVSDSLWRPALASLLALLFACATGPASASAIVCKPLLSFKNVREIRSATAPVAPWIWRVSIVANANYCATRTGQFEIDFIRIKENSADLQFTEKLRWRAGQFDVSIDLAADEAILDYRIGFIAPCVCPDFPVADDR